MDRSKPGNVKFGDMLRPQLLQGGHDILQIPPKLADRHSPAGTRPVLQPFPATLIDLEGTGVVMAGNMQVDHTHLQYAAVQITQRAGFFPPGRLERFVGFEIIPVVEQFQPLDGFRVERAIAVSRSGCIQIGHAEWNYIIPDGTRLQVQGDFQHLVGASLN